MLSDSGIDSPCHILKRSRNKSRTHGRFVTPRGQAASEDPAFPIAATHQIRHSFGVSSLNDLDHRKQAHQRVKAIFAAGITTEAIVDHCEQAAIRVQIRPRREPLPDSGREPLPVLLPSLAPYRISRNANFRIGIGRIAFCDDYLLGTKQIGQTAIEGPDPDPLTKGLDQFSPPGNCRLAHLRCTHGPEQHGGWRKAWSRTLAQTQQILFPDTQALEQMCLKRAAGARRIKGTPQRNL